MGNLQRSPEPYQDFWQIIGDSEGGEGGSGEEVQQGAE
jgi:hypothetical protein